MTVDRFGENGVTAETIEIALGMADERLSFLLRRHRSRGIEGGSRYA